MDIYGVIGWPIRHSLSPAMHNAAFKKLGIDAEYRKFEIRPEGLEDFLLNRKDVVGFNITVPHKVKAKEILEKKFPTNDSFVRRTGAVNTVVRTDKEHLQYTNTDVDGFLMSLKEDLNFDLKDKNVFLVGCGGAGRAVIAGLAGHYDDISAKKVYIYDINKSTREETKKFFQRFGLFEDGLETVSKEQIGDVIKNCDLLVNASPVGMEEGDNNSPIGKQLLHEGLSVYDIVYNRRTQLIKDAEEKKRPCKDGRGMLAYQAAFSFSLWRAGVKPVDVINVMKEALDKALK